MEGTENEIKGKTYYCDCCNFTSFKKFSFERHNSTSKHIFKINGSEKPKKIGQTYNCICCNFTTLKKKDFERHNITSKHIKNSKLLVNENESSIQNTNIQEQITPIIESPNEINLTSLVIELLKDNKELRNSIIELSKIIVTKL